MKTIECKDNIICKKDLKNIKNSLKIGNLIIFPTETVYGIGANALDANAVKKIFIAKKRAMDNPLIVHLSDVKHIKKYAIVTNQIEKKLISAFMPGPFTLILKKKSIIPNNVSANLNTVGIRIPSNPIAHRILQKTKIPIAAPSANISGNPSGTQIEDIVDEFNDTVDYIVDGKVSDIGLESTVVKVINNIPTILRPGYVTKEDILNVIGKVIVDKSVFVNTAVGKIESPGMKYKHYAPKSKCLLIYSKNKKRLIEEITKNITSKTIVLGSDSLKTINCYKYINYGNTLEDISHNLYSLLRKADKYYPDLIIIEGVNEVGLGLAIMNRLIRASNNNYIRIK